mmetsp:Transcript_17831/g.44608  ORF Transcript_17831/g.44608 Transcript_17831/m.44608 type:complete len:299 (-) Transcript_17831:210-1106(-)
MSGDEKPAEQEVPPTLLEEDGNANKPEDAQAPDKPGDAADAGANDDLPPAPADDAAAAPPGDAPTETNSAAAAVDDSGQPAEQEDEKAPGAGGAPSPPPSKITTGEEKIYEHTEGGEDEHVVLSKGEGDPFADYDSTGEMYKIYEVRNKYSFAPFELSDFARGFQIVDILGEGLLTPVQVDKAMTIIGQQQDPPEFEWAINQTDPEATGLWDFQRFIDVMALFRKPPLTEVELRETFDLMDADKSGAVSAGELRQLMMCVGNSLTIEEAEDMISIADNDCSGEIEFNEFRRFIYCSAV